MPGGPSMGMGGRADDSASTKAYRIANARMHAGMAVDYSGNADADFVRGMIAHHRGSIEMAETVLQFGEDPEIRKLAEGVIAAQEAEVAELRRWLLAHKGAAR
ncbi:CopM family metallochaperone [Chthonobacter rhizosphaerae]|uniref:CopM family metallochaperone n=1 Tax=Chthonobacter rhizosphaerae TaxID=2735553 RepID=UPI003CCD0287